MFCICGERIDYYDAANPAHCRREIEDVFPIGRVEVLAIFCSEACLPTILRTRLDHRRGICAFRFDSLDSDSLPTN